MILVFILTHNLFKLVFSSQHMRLMLKDMGFVIEDSFSGNRGAGCLYHRQMSLLSPQRFSLNPPIFSEAGPIQRKCYWVCKAREDLWGPNI